MRIESPLTVSGCCNCAVHTTTSAGVRGMHKRGCSAPGWCVQYAWVPLLRAGGCGGWMLRSMPLAALRFGCETTGAVVHKWHAAARRGVRVPPPCAGHVDEGARVEGDAGCGRVCANTAARPHAVPRRLCQHLLLQDVWLPDRPRRPPGALPPPVATAATTACCKSSIPTANEASRRYFAFSKIIGKSIGL